MTEEATTASAELEARVTRLEDERAILATLYRYCYAADSGDAEGWADCFTEDGCIEGDRVGTRVRGRKAIAELLRNSPMVPSGEWVIRHYFLNPLITFEDGGASVRSYFLVLRKSEAGEAFIRAFGYYQDRMVKSEDGKWRFAERSHEYAYLGETLEAKSA